MPLTAQLQVVLARTVSKTAHAFLSETAKKLGEHAALERQVKELDDIFKDMKDIIGEETTVSARTAFEDTLTIFESGVVQEKIKAAGKESEYNLTLKKDLYVADLAILKGSDTVHLRACGLIMQGIIRLLWNILYAKEKSKTLPEALKDVNRALVAKSTRIGEALSSASSNALVDLPKEIDNCLAYCERMETSYKIKAVLKSNQERSVWEMQMQLRHRYKNNLDSSDNDNSIGRRHVCRIGDFGAMTRRQMHLYQLLDR